MKRCNSCNAVYDDSYNICPTCGVRLTTLSGNEERLAQRNAQNGNTGAYSAGTSYAGTTTQRRNQPAYRFVEQDGSTVVFNGAVAEANTQQFYQSKFTKIIRAVFSSEPYQLSHTSYLTVFRVEEHSINNYPEQAQDIVLFGGIQNVLAPGDDVTVRAKRKGNRYVAKSIYNHSINSNVRLEANIPAGVVKFLFWALVLAVFWIIYSIATMNYAAIGQAIIQFITSLIPTILTIAILWYIIKAFFKK